MKALQYIYTSWKNGDSTEKGYRIYSMSGGITDEECNEIKEVMQYVPPKGMNAAPSHDEILQTFPYSFAYFRFSDGKACIAQSTYLGKDYSGRYGNYIIYAMVFDGDNLDFIPCEMFAEPYIKTFMTQAELDAPSPVPPLPELEIDETGIYVNEDSVSDFILDHEDDFKKVMSCFMAARSRNVPFYLNDTRENMVMWCAAIESVLPDKLLPLFAFTTYCGQAGNEDAFKERRIHLLGIDLTLFGVRPDANFFDYEIASHRNTAVVLDLVAGIMTEDVQISRFAEMMTLSIEMDGAEKEQFSQFLDTTSYDSLDNQLEVAYEYYCVLKHVDFIPHQQDLISIFTFGDHYCSLNDNAVVGGRILDICTFEEWDLDDKALSFLWKFIGKNACFLGYKLFPYLSSIISTHIVNEQKDDSSLREFVFSMRADSAELYKDYLEYINNEENSEQFLSLLENNEASVTLNEFFSDWMVNSYSFENGINDQKPSSGIITKAISNLCVLNTKKTWNYLMNLLLRCMNRKELFNSLLSCILSGSTNDGIEKLVDEYIEQFQMGEEGENEADLDKFESMLLVAPDAGFLTSRVYARSIRASHKPEKTFWKLYHQLQNVNENERPVGLMINACLESVAEKKRFDAACTIISKVPAIDISAARQIVQISESQEIKTLSKADRSILLRITELAEKSGVTSNKTTAVCGMRMIEEILDSKSRPIHLAENVDGFDISSFSKGDYETFCKLYSAAAVSAVRSASDAEKTVEMFNRSTGFSAFADEVVRYLKKVPAREHNKYMMILSSYLIYSTEPERYPGNAQIIYRKLIHYLHGIDETEMSQLFDILSSKGVSKKRIEIIRADIEKKESIGDKFINIFK